MFLFRVESLECKVLINQLFYLRTYSVSLIPHHDNSRLPIIPLCTYFLRRGMCRTTEFALPLGLSSSLQFRIMDFYVCQCAHCGLYGLRAENICGVGAANDMFDAEPVGKPYDGTEIAGVLYAVQC